MSDENIVSEPRPIDPNRNYRPDRLIHEITLRNILSFGPDSPTLKLGNLNVLIGPNGSGKSNLIEVIGLLQAAPRDIWQPIRSGGGMREWVFKGPLDLLTDISAIVHFEQGQPLLKYSQLFRTDEAEPYLQETVKNAPGESEVREYFGVVGWQMAKILSHGELRTIRYDVLHGSSVLRDRRDPDATPELAYLATKFEEIRIYRDWSFGRANPLRAAQRTDMPGARLDEDFGNFGMFLNRRFSKHPQYRKRLVEAMQSIYGDFSDVQFEIDSNTVHVLVYEGQRIIPAKRLSDGTLRYLMLCAVLLDPEPAPLICIEEPELGLHPDVVGKLAELLKDASQRTQLIVTTHSSTLIDHLTDMPEAVVVFGKEKGATTMERLQPGKLQVWLKQYNDSLGALWTSGEIGGNRW